LIGKPERRKETTWKKEKYTEGYYWNGFKEIGGRLWTALIWLMVGRSGRLLYKC
jgi:hypothetical protein